MTTITTTAERICATCTRTYDPDAATSHQWITRFDGLGLMCRTCQNREARGVATEREAGR